ncbi:hypothetical protein TNCV_2339731 [Trichonephila clavipes]|nr:hypothetical protein TNCV_2339731 [Trichonephila clavipes]
MQVVRWSRYYHGPISFSQKSQIIVVNRAALLGGPGSRVVKGPGVQLLNHLTTPVKRGDAVEPRCEGDGGLMAEDHKLSFAMEEGFVGKRGRKGSKHIQRYLDKHAGHGLKTPTLKCDINEKSNHIKPVDKDVLRLFETLGLEKPLKYPGTSGAHKGVS